MRRTLTIISVIFILGGVFPAAAFCLDAESISGEVARLGREAPTLAAFPDTAGVLWMNSDSYSLTGEGGKKHDNTFVMLLGDASAGGGASSRRMPYPRGDGAALEITEAAFYDPSSGARLGDLPRREYDIGGIKGVEVAFPEDAEGFAVVIAYTETVPGDYYLDDVIFLAGELPAWEQTVTVEVPDGMKIYWDGEGIGTPESVKNGRIERTTWTVLNEPEWRNAGMIDSGRPILAFSLERGHLAVLKKLKALEGASYAPKIPASVMSSKADSARAVESIAKFMSPRLLPQEAGTDTARSIEAIGADGPWTAWEQVMIAGRWMASLGFDARIYWAQKFPSGPDGPASLSIWREPVLRVTDGKGRDVYFKAGQKGDPEKLHPSLYGETLYRAGNAGVEQIKLPRGSASDHALTQNWKMVLGENGAASGSLDVTFTGAWMGILAPNGEIEEENIVAELLEIMNFDTPGIDFEAKSLKPLGSGCRITLDFTAAPGIVSQNNILFRLVGGVPRSFEEIPKVGAKYSFRFPFVFEVNSTVVTPKGYRALALPGKTQIGDSKSALDQSLVHWTKRRIAEASCRWIVRSAAVDEYQSGRIAEQVALVTAWPATAVPLQK